MSFARIIAAASLALATVPAMANTISSDACAPGARDFTVTATTVHSCLAVGNGNINGNNQDDAFLISAGWVMIDASDTNGGTHNGWLTSTGSLTSGLSGDFIINALAYTTYDRIAIGFKSGAGQLTPTWAIFELEDGTLTGDWTISGQNALSHAILYGIGEPGGGGETGVPEPGILALAGLGLAAFGAARRRKQA